MEHSDSRLRILVVDDMENWRDLLATLLQEEGYVVQTASSQGEARTALEHQRFHLAILDLRLVDSDDANVDGLHLLHEICQLGRKTAVIVITGYGTSQQFETAFQDGVFDLVEKHTFDAERFRKTVATALGKATHRE